MATTEQAVQEQLEAARRHAYHRDVVRSTSRAREMIAELSR